MRDGYPASYFDNGRFEFPWEKDIKKPLDNTSTLTNSQDSNSMAAVKTTKETAT